MASGLIGIGITALNAAQAGLVTTQHNIANVNTPGFSRQQTVLSAEIAQYTGSGFFGNGVQVESVRRIVNQFLDNQVVAAQGSLSREEAYFGMVSQIDSLLGNSGTGLSSALQDFFNAVHEVANNPGSLVPRQTLIAYAQTLSSRFQGIANQLDTLRSGVDSQLSGSVSTVNNLARQLADLNNKIASLQGSGQPPNDLLDQRDELVRQLAEEIGVTAAPQSDGSYNVFIGQGQALVLGGQSFDLSLVSSREDPTRSVLAVRIGATAVEIPETTIGGGRIGGLLAFRSESLDTAQSLIGRIAIGLTDAFNTQHAMGFDLNSAAGGNFFAPISLKAPIANTGNTGSGVVGISLSGIAGLTGSDYRLSYDGANYVVTRLSDNANVYTGAAFPAVPIDGFNLSLASGTINAGDSFLIRPTFSGAGSVAVAISDPSLIAAASTPGGILDNGNALTLASLGSTNILSGGAASLETAYSQVVGQIAVLTQRADNNQQAESVVLNDAIAAQQSASGVNLDEEAANLIRYQQAFQAAGKAIQVASTLFDTILAIGS
jgi:flagellar hook-associated protein 1